MNIETFEKAIGMMAGFFGKKLSADALAFYGADFKFTDDDIFWTACKNVCRTEKTFPTPRTLREYVATAGHAKNNAASARKLSEIYTDRLGDSEDLKAGRGLLRLIYEQNLYGDDLIAEMRLMEKSFPGVGWCQAAAELEANLTKSHT